ncbi:MAG: PhzF family phenazine biosynthesis protein [Planctomycetota bacterium]
MTQRALPIWQVDAFASEPFKGNPAAVCVLDRYPDDRWLQNLAIEMNLSETAFVVPMETPGNFHLRWFTPAAEVDLCGHATLASAHTLIEQNVVSPNAPIRFQTRSGELTCHQSGDHITLDFPAIPVTGTADETLAKDVRSALGIETAQVMTSKFDLLVIIDAESTVRGLKPDFHRLSMIPVRGVIVSAVSDDASIDFVSRFFAPQHNIDEDPVTGSAHCCLTPYWSEKLDKTSLVGYQASSRGGTVYCELNRSSQHGDSESGDRVKLSGSAVTVMEGSLKVSF